MDNETERYERELRLLVGDAMSRFADDRSPVDYTLGGERLKLKLMTVRDNLAEKSRIYSRVVKRQRVEAPVGIRDHWAYRSGFIPGVGAFSKGGGEFSGLNMEQYFNYRSYTTSEKKDIEEGIEELVSDYNKLLEEVSKRIEGLGTWEKSDEDAELIRSSLNSYYERRSEIYNILIDTQIPSLYNTLYETLGNNVNINDIENSQAEPIAQIILDYINAVTGVTIDIKKDDDTTLNKTAVAVSYFDQNIKDGVRLTLGKKQFVTPDLDKGGKQTLVQSFAIDFQNWRENNSNLGVNQQVISNATSNLSSSIVTLQNIVNHVNSNTRRDYADIEKDIDLTQGSIAQKEPVVMIWEEWLARRARDYATPLKKAEDDIVRLNTINDNINELVTDLRASDLSKNGEIMLTATEMNGFPPLESRMKNAADLVVEEMRSVYENWVADPASLKRALMDEPTGAIFAECVGTKKQMLHDQLMPDRARQIDLANQFPIAYAVAKKKLTQYRYIDGRMEK